MIRRLLKGRPVKIATLGVVLAGCVLLIMLANRNLEPQPTEKLVGTAVVPATRVDSSATEDVEEEIDFSDPTSGGLIPLMRVEGRQDERLSPNLRVGDLAARDGAPFARISVELIEALEDVIASTEARIFIVSGYRHPARNALPEIGGSVESQHIAGRAADLSSPDLSALELAGLTLDAVGCEIGLGLGETSIHMDVRGRRALWVRSGAELDSDAFARWVRARCGEEVEGDDTEIDTREAGLDFDAAIAQFEEAMRTTARRLADAGLDGGVALDLRGDLPIVYAVPAGAPDAVGLGLEELIGQAHPGRYFAFACIVKDGDVVRGFLRL